MKRCRHIVLVVFCLGLLVLGSPLVAQSEITKVTLQVAGMT